MVVATARRVEENTAPSINDARQREIDQRLRYYALHRGEIPARLAELDSEWDIERAIEANAASVALTGFGLAALAGRKFLVIPFAVAGFLLQHAIQGWCPPVPVLRRLGFRTAAEIYRERCALEALRDDRPMIEASPRQFSAGADTLHEGVEAVAQ